MRDEHRFREKIQLSLENRHVAGLAFAALLLLGAAFSLGVLVGKRLASRAAVPSATDDLEALDAERGVQQSSILPGEPSLRSVQTPRAAQTARAGQTTAQTARAGETLRAAQNSRGSDDPVAASPHGSDGGRASPAGRASGEAAKASSRSEASDEGASASPHSDASSDAAKAAGAAGKSAGSPPPPSDRGRTASARQVQEPPSAKTVAPAGTPSTVQASQVGTLPDPPLDAGKFTVQVGATQDRAEARALVGRVTKSGLQPYVVRTELPGKGLWYRVRVGAFTDRPAAERYRKDLERELRMPALVMPSR